MRKDFKTGLFTGLALASIVMVWLSFKTAPQQTRPAAESTKRPQETSPVPSPVPREAVIIKTNTTIKAFPESAIRVKQ